MGFNADSRTVNAGKNAASAIANRLAVLLLTFLSRKFFIQYIGVAYLGVNGLFSNILTLLSMADLGLGTAMNVSLYRPIAENDEKKLSAMLRYFRSLYLVIAMGVTCVGLALTPFLGHIVNMDQKMPYLSAYYVIFVLKSAASYLFIYKASMVRADQKSYLINKIEVYVNIGKIVLQFLAVVTIHSYFAFLLLDVAAVVAQNVLVSRAADRQYAFLREKNELSEGEKKRIFTDASSAFLYKIAWSLLNGTDNILMSAMIGTVYVGYYSNYYTITNNLETFVALLFTSLTAGVGNLVATAAPERRYRTFRSMQMASFWICGNVSVCLLYLTQDFMALWLGEGMLLDGLTLAAIVLNVFFSICMRPVWTFREGTGMYRQIRYIMFATAVLNLALSVILGRIMGISGIVLATSVSKAATYFWYEPNLLYRKFFGKSPASYYVGHLKNFGLLAVCIGLCYVPVKRIRGSGAVHWAAKALICIVIVNAAYFLRYCRTEEFLDVKGKAMRFLHRE